MGQEIKRVPLNFADHHPLETTWPGYLNPYYALGHICPDCKGTLHSPEARLYENLWYCQSVHHQLTALHAMPDGPLKTDLMHLAQAISLRETGSDPNYTAWCYNLEEQDLPALIAHHYLAPGASLQDAKEYARTLFDFDSVATTVVIEARLAPFNL